MGLKGATKYTVGAVDCLKDDEGCGKPVETTVTTPPPRELRTYIILDDGSNFTPSPQ